VGTFRFHARENHWEWSDEVARMHGYEPGTVTPTTDLVLAHKHPDDKSTVDDLIERLAHVGVELIGDVDVEAGSADDVSVLVVPAVADHDNPVDLAPACRRCDGGC
jgi:hypothetical protein